MSGLSPPKVTHERHVDRHRSRPRPADRYRRARDRYGTTVRRYWYGRTRTRRPGHRYAGHRTGTGGRFGGTGAGRVSTAFATARDVVADAVATLARSLPMLPRIRAAGYPAALVAQDGLEHLTVPWDRFDVLFLGATTAWKLGPAAAALATQARRRGVWVHLGRVNSLRRLRYAAAIGCHSVDGTHLVYGPNRKLPELLRWLTTVNQPTATEPTTTTEPTANEFSPPEGAHHHA